MAFLALSTLLAAPFPINRNALGDHRIPTDEAEKTAVIDAGKTLLTPEFGSGEKDDLIKALLGALRDGSFEGVSCGYILYVLSLRCIVSLTEKNWYHSIDDRLRQIAAQFIHPPTPIPSAPASPVLAATATANGHAHPAPIDFTAGASLSREATPTPTVQAAVSASFLPMPTTGSFQFMSASDLDLDPSNDITEQDAPVAPTSEWVHVEESQPAPSFGVPPEEVVQESAVMSGDVEKLVNEETQELQTEIQVSKIPISNVSLFCLNESFPER